MSIDLFSFCQIGTKICIYCTKDRTKLYTIIGINDKYRIKKSQVENKEGMIKRRKKLSQKKLQTSVCNLHRQRAKKIESAVVIPRIFTSTMITMLRIDIHDRRHLICIAIFHSSVFRTNVKEMSQFSQIILNILHCYGNVLTEYFYLYTERV